LQNPRQGYGEKKKERKFSENEQVLNRWDDSVQEVGFEYEQVPGCLNASRRDGCPKSAGNKG
tara:strand:+ start:621 stop:806 length:186 start_codon:yes stop_codon:yes gene_type:complete